jgi:hypothetical protein
MWQSAEQAIQVLGVNLNRSCTYVAGICVCSLRVAIVECIGSEIPRIVLGFINPIRLTKCVRKVCANSRLSYWIGFVSRIAMAKVLKLCGTVLVSSAITTPTTPLT